MVNKIKNRVLVIGGSGFIGSHTADSLTNLGYKVTIFDLIDSKWRKKKQKFIKGNILDYNQLELAIAETDFVYHLAATADIAESYNDPINLLNNNIIGTTNIASLCSKYKIKKLIFGSSMYAFSNKGSFYKVSKISSEKIIEEYHKSYSLNYLIIRFGSLFGPRSQKWNGITKYINAIIKAKNSIQYHGTGEEKREFIYVCDAADMCAELIQNKTINQCLNITGIQQLKTKEFLEMILEILNKKVLIKYSKNSKDNSHYSITPYSFTPNKSKTIVPTEFTDIGQGILELIKEINSKS